MAETFQIRFEDISPAQAAEDADVLEQAINTALREAGEAPVAQQTKLDMNTADLGTVVELVLAAPATVILARGIAKAISSYFARTDRGSLVFKRPDGTQVTIRNMESRDLGKLSDVILGKR